VSTGNITDFKDDVKPWFRARRPESKISRMSPAIRASIALSLMVGFYLLALGLSVALLWFAWMAIQLRNVGALKIALFAAAAGGSVLWSLRPRRVPFNPPGPLITRAQHPELFEVLEDVALKTHQQMPATVYIAPDLNAAVLHRGGVLGLGGSRTMILGLPLLHVVTVDQLKAIVAHEFGHFGGGDTKIGRLVYHTRAGLAATLSAVEGHWIETVFNAYGKIVMRISMAVSRHQEFGADAFAARAVSRRDMIDGLQAVHRFGPHFPAFLFTNVLPVFQAGYRPPIGSGFAAYCAAVPATSPEEHHDLDPHNGLYDSHPPLEERVSALERLQPDHPRVADNRPASELLNDTAEIEASLYQFPGPRTRLQLIGWNDVTERVMIPYWRHVMEERRSTLKAVAIDALPTSPAAIMKLVRSSPTDLKLKMRDDVEIIQIVMHAVTAAITLRLLDKGWRPASSAGTIGTLEHGHERFEAISRVYGVLLGETPVEEWAAFCRRHELSGPLA
jgi:heat shock protein HtpX